MSRLSSADALVPRLESQKTGRECKWPNSARSPGLHSATCAHHQQAPAITSAGCLQNWRLEVVLKVDFDCCLVMFKSVCKPVNWLQSGK